MRGYTSKLQLLPNSLLSSMFKQTSFFFLLQLKKIVTWRQSQNSHTCCISQLLVQCALSFRPNILVYISGNFQGESPGKRSTSRVIPNCFKKIFDRGLPFHLILLLGILSSMIQQSFWKLSNEISVPFTPVSKVQGFFRRMERAQCDRSVLQPLALSFKRLTNG